MDRRLYLFFVITLSTTLSQTGRAQPKTSTPRLINRSTARQDSAFLFVAYENKVEIASYSNASWRLVGRAEIHKGDSPWLFVVVPQDAGPDTLQLFRNGKLILTKVFYAIYESYPVTRLGSITDSFATKAEIIANRLIRVFEPNCTECGWKVIDYQIKLESNLVADWQKKFSNPGPVLSETAISMVRLLGPGDKIAFSEIRALCKSCRVHVFYGFTLTIK